jgi:hypothetical protein
MAGTPSNHQSRIPGLTIEELINFDYNFAEIFNFTQHNEPEGVKYTTVTKEGVKQLWKYKYLCRILPPHEVTGQRFAQIMQDWIKSSGGKFLRDELGGYHILIGGHRIPIDATSDEMKAFLLDTCDITSLSVAAGMAVERLRIMAHESASKMMFRRFSAMYDGPEPRVYLPVAEPGKILLVTPDEISLVLNGDNPDQLWLEHPENNPFKLVSTRIEWEDVRGALREFQEHIVDSQACAVPAMRWFVAMAEGLFPLVRDTVSNRFIIVHKGSKGHGKTTGAKSPILLHGFEDVFMDASVAALGNIPEQGLVAIDNKESRNFTQPLIDYFLSIATGGKRLRSLEGGTAVRRNAPRPVAVITSIEGVHKAELHDRCIDVKYFLTAGQKRLKRGRLERLIVESRNRIMSALVVVLQEYLTTRVDPVAREILASVNPIDRFSEHFEEVCYLLVAFGRVALGADGDAWAKEIIAAWDRAIRETRGDEALDAPVSALEAPVLAAAMDGHIPVPFRWQERPGKLYIVFPGDVLAALQRNLALRDLPTEPGQLVERLESEHFERFVFLTARTSGEDGKPLGLKGTGILRRRESGQPVGVWVPDDVA